MAPTTILISGANGGLGKGLLEIYLQKPHHTVIAANRSLTHPTALFLATLPTHPSSRLILVKIDAIVEADPFNAVKTLREEHGIDVRELKIKDLQAHLEPNVFGVVWLYQATFPLLLKAKALRNQLPITDAAYAPLKVAVHWLTKKMNAEEEKLNAFVLSPGWCQTELGNTGEHAFGMEEAPVTVEE
ncbi:hypothetical protein G7Y89_g14261 [Cudoniella acicularis]|uniref:NAD(P)-binding protein n=1 Tax=Cudoniella acicularis TaxID=354080 RepID=A0A8H4VU31_9HELO|nr:hypothetical protein G7Y89_g14261 [Cudoniella acicularis]